MPHNLSSPSGDTLLASAVDDLPSEPTLHVVDLGTPSRRHTGLDGRADAGPPGRRVRLVCRAARLRSGDAHPVDAAPAAHASPDDRLAVVKARASLLLTLVGVGGRLPSSPRAPAITSAPSHEMRL